MAFDKISKGQAPRAHSVDFTRIRKKFQGAPQNYVSFGVVGHYDQNPAFSRVESSKVLVEVTLIPSGDEVVAELGLEGQGAGFDWYIPVCIGCRVLVAFPGGEEEPVIIKRITDSEFPFPTDVAGIPTVGVPVDPLTGSTAAPQFAFMRVPDGTILAIETGVGGDLVVSSGANMKMEVGAGDSIHLNGRVHLGEDFSTPPVGASTAPAGETLPGVPALKHVPIPSVPVPFDPLPTVPTPGLPQDGIVRLKDQVQSDITVDPAWWLFVSALYANPLIGPALAAAGITVPLALSSLAKNSSKHTASDA